MHVTGGNSMHGCDLNITAVGGTDIGRKRDHNEDGYALFPETGLYLVADGMGGHAAGELASRIAVDVVGGFITATASKEDITWPYGLVETLGRAGNRLVAAVRLANKAVREKAASSPELKGMGTTVVAALAEEGVMNIAHVGDSRAYLFRGGRLTRLTADHSFVEEQVRAGIITAEAARTHPMRNIITRALGVKDDLTVDVTEHMLMSGDTYLLCTDGLTGMVEDAEMERALDVVPDAQDCVDTLIALANKNGGNDNITTVLVKVS